MDAILPTPGTYVVAVSGGVDSVALLHMLHQQPDLKLVVAHYDHGIREDSAEDRRLVQRLAEEYQLPYIYDEGRLGAGTSEAEARTARYAFLRRVQAASEAQAVITAHHQDDVLETAIINLLRGTGRKGLTSLQSTADIQRPLLSVSKAAIRAYAQDQGLRWREDSTNQDESYLRNYVRHQLLTRFSPAERQQLLDIVAEAKITNQELDTLLVKYLQAQSVSGGLNRVYFNALSHNVAREVLADWLRQHGITSFDAKAIERLVVVAKTGRPGQRYPIVQNHHMVIEPTFVIIDIHG